MPQLRSDAGANGGKAAYEAESPKAEPSYVKPRELRILADHFPYFVTTSTRVAPTPPARPGSCPLFRFRNRFPAIRELCRKEFVMNLDIHFFAFNPCVATP